MDHAVTSSSADTPPLAPPVRPTGRVWWWVAAAIAGGGIVVTALSLKPAMPPADTRSADLVAGKDDITVRDGTAPWKFLKLGTVGAVGLHWTDPFPGRISIDESLSSRVGVPVDGRVTRVMVELGDSVREGQPLLAIASPALDDLRSSRAQAQVELEAARTALGRIEASVASRALPLKDQQAAQQRVRAAEVAARLADDKLATLRGSADSAELVIRAPRSGVVVEKTVLVNQQVQPDGQPLVVVADLSHVWAIADVFESQVVDLRTGGTAEVTSASMPGQTMTGSILMVSSIGDPERHTLPVRVRLANPDHRLRPNVYARIRFSVQHPDASVEIPATAVVSDGEHQYVYVQNTPGHFVRREIVAGSAHESRLPVIKGLATGETIVEDGAILLDNQIAISQ